MKIIYTIAILLTTLTAAAQDTALSKVWVADNGDGTYKNPVIHADYSDPDAIRVGDDYYMISSSFNHVPGLPILHSKDLINWKLIGHALLQQVPVDHFSKVQHGGGVWAPSIRYYKGEFFIYYPDPDFGLYLTKSKTISGPWSKPMLVIAGKGLIDPCPLWDENNGITKLYLVHAYAGSRAGIKSIIVVRELNSEGTDAIKDPVLVYDGHQSDPTIEGPKFHKRNGYYYIFAPAGGVSTGWQLVLRSKNVYGPYERKIVMNQGSTTINGPHQGAWIQTKKGEHWFLHFQDKALYGRVVHLQPMKWVNDWPVIGIDPDGDGKGETVLSYIKPAHEKKFERTTVADADEFNSPSISKQWQWQANPGEGWAYATSSGTLKMFSVHQPDTLNNLWKLPSILGQKLPAENFIATMKFRFSPRFTNERFGLVMLGSDYAHISVVKEIDGLYIRCMENINADRNGIEKEIAGFPWKGNDCFFEVRMEKDGVYYFAFSEDGKEFTTIIKGFKAKPGRWVGAKLGLFCTRTNVTNDAGYVDIDWIRFSSQ